MALACNVKPSCLDVFVTSRWGVDYLVKCFIQPDTVVLIVGNPPVDHNVWTKPEEADDRRINDVVVVNSTHPGSDLAAAMAAALASASRVFAGVDPVYSAMLVERAEALYR